MIESDQNNSCVEWESYDFTITGKWSMKGNSVRSVFDKPKASIDSIFALAKLNISNKPIIEFSSQMDTAFIYGIPCLLLDMSK